MTDLLKSCEQRDKEKRFYNRLYGAACAFLFIVVMIALHSLWVRL